MINKAWRTAALLCGIVILTTGCVQQEDPGSQIRSFLATEQGPEDTSALIPKIDGLDAESSREVGAVDTLHYFVAAFGGSGACLIIVDSASEAAAVTCSNDESGLSGLKKTDSQVGGAEVVTSGEEVPDGWERLSDFLIVNPDATQ